MSVSERFAGAVGRLLERKVSRRSALSRAALAGSAFAVAPVRYMVRPGTAWAVLRPESCRTGLCTDGYTAFCCEIQHGDNRCPNGTYVAGWWKCTAYNGHGLCADDGVRYYIDCNRTPGTVFPGGCQCAKKHVEAKQGQAAGHPAAEKLSKNQLRPAQRLGQQRQQSTLFSLRRDLPGGCGNGDDQ